MGHLLASGKNGDGTNTLKLFAEEEVQAGGGTCLLQKISDGTNTLKLFGALTEQLLPLLNVCSREKRKQMRHPLASEKWRRKNKL